MEKKKNIPKLLRIGRVEFRFSNVNEGTRFALGYADVKASYSKINAKNTRNSPPKKTRTGKKI